MIWFAWRVQRLYLLVAAAAVAGAAVWFTIQGLHEQSFWNCLLNHIRPQGAYAYCSAAWSPYNINHWNSYLYGILYALPGLVGIVLGAQLVARDFEHKTARIAWTQSVTRTRWLTTKLLFVGVVVGVLTAGGVGLAEWWTGAIRSGPKVLPGPFDVTGLVPISYGLFAFLLGTALGALFRRTGWAVFLAVPLFGLARALLRIDVRSHLASTVATTFPSMPDYRLSSFIFQRGWVLHTGYLPLGRLAPPGGSTWTTWQNVADSCLRYSYVQLTPNSRVGTPHLDRFCLLAHRLHYVIQYQPQSHYWRLQAEESAIFLVVGLLLAAVAFLAVRTRSA